MCLYCQFHCRENADSRLNCVVSCDTPLLHSSWRLPITRKKLVLPNGFDCLFSTFFLFVWTPLSRYFIKINLLGLKLQFKGTSSYLQTFVIFMCLAASQTVFTEILCRLFPSADWKRKRDNEGGKEGKLIILGVFWGRLPTFIDLSPFFFTQENKNVE